jgi:hypothetical protein
VNGAWRTVWVSHPRHLPPVPPGNTVVLDVAFAADNQWKSKTKPFVQALGDRLRAYVDHHEHVEAWAAYAKDPRFVLVTNQIAHACPELVTQALVERTGAIDTIVAHHDFDGLVSALKWMNGGVEPWEHADEDARAIDSPGRGHRLGAFGARVAYAVDEVLSQTDRDAEQKFLTSLARDWLADPELRGRRQELDVLGQQARHAEDEGLRLCEAHGALEVPGVFVVRLPRKLDNRMRRNVLMAAEARASIGALHEPDPMGGAWLTAATFDVRIDLAKIPALSGGRSDYRFARATDGGHDLIQALHDLTASLASTSSSPSGALGPLP